jgi:hypothetical protein
LAFEFELLPGSCPLVVAELLNPSIVIEIPTEPPTDQPSNSSASSARASRAFESEGRALGDWTLAEGDVDDVAV